MMNVFWTILAGVLVFAGSQFILKLILEPLVEFRKVLSEISHTMLFNQPAIFSCMEKNDKLSETISLLSAKLRSTTYLIPRYQIMGKLPFFKLKEDIKKACFKMNQLSHNVRDPGEDPGNVVAQNKQILEELDKLLKIETTYLSENEVMTMLKT